MSSGPRILALSGGPAVEAPMAVAQAALLAHGLEVTRLDLGDLVLPLFDSEATRVAPAAATTLANAIRGHDGFFVAVPEVFGALAPVVLNALLWAQRPTAKADASPILTGKIAAMVAAAPYGGSGVKALSQLANILGGLGAVVLPYPVGVAGPASGSKALDSGHKAQIERLATEFAAALQRLKAYTS